MTLSSDTIVKRAVAVPFTRLGDELLALDQDAGYLYALNETGGVIWDLLDSPIAVDELCARLRQEYSVDEPTCRAEVIQVLEGLRQAGLVEIL